MKSKTVILMVVAIVCGLAASYMTSRLLADRNERVSILVAKQRFNAWTPIKNPEEQFEIEERLKNEVPKNAVTKFESAKDHVLIKGMDKGDPLVAENMLDKNKGGLEVVLPPGKRAVAIRTTAEAVAGGFVLPGSRVDVIHTLKRGDKEAESRVVLENILVRAVDQTAMKPDDRPGLVPATVTLEVTPRQAIILASVKDHGSLTLALRPYGDDKVSASDYQVASVAPPPPPPAPAKAESKDSPKPVVKAAPVDRKTLFIQNGQNWTRATYVTQNGQTHTTIEHSQTDSYTTTAPAPAPVPTPPVAPKTGGSAGAAK
jgi:pilus assembly protein CpaB